jgi:hypothetical protein
VNYGVGEAAWAAAVSLCRAAAVSVCLQWPGLPQLRVAVGGGGLVAVGGTGVRVAVGGMGVLVRVAVGVFVALGAGGLAVAVKAGRVALAASVGVADEPTSVKETANVLPDVGEGPGVSVLVGDGEAVGGNGLSPGARVCVAVGGEVGKMSPRENGVGVP